MNRGVVFAVGLALVVADSAMAADGPLPGLPVPELPGVPEVPEVPIPPVIDQLPAPVPAVPSVVPSLPAIPVPLAAPAPPAPGGTSANSVGGAAPSGSGSRPAPTAAARNGISPTRAAPSSAVAGNRISPTRARPAGRSAAGRSAAVAAAGRAAANPRVRRRERRLRRTVTRLRGCLDGLPRLERKVLLLRSGLGPRHARSRARVARALDLRPGRVRRIERRGLRRLRGLARGGCGGGSGEPAAEAAPATAPAVFGFGRTLTAATELAALEPDRVEVKGEQQSSLPNRGGAAPKPAPPAKPRPDRPPPAAILERGDGSTELTLLVLGLVALLVVIAFVVEARRILRR